MVLMSTAGLMANGEGATLSSVESQATVQDLDRQIHLLKDNIEKYKALAKTFDRKVGSLQSHDYTGARDAAALRDECQGIAKDLESHLAKLEERRAQMVGQEKTKN